MNPDELDLDITLTPVSAIDEEAKAEQQQKQISNARDMWDVLTSMKDTLEAEENAPKINFQSVAEYIMSDYLEIDKNLIDQVFNRPVEDKTEMSRIRSHRIYAGTDVHAMYPSDENQHEYERIRESMITEKVE